MKNVYHWSLGKSKLNYNEMELFMYQNSNNFFKNLKLTLPNAGEDTEK